MISSCRWSGVRGGSFRPEPPATPGLTQLRLTGVFCVPLSLPWCPNSVTRRVGPLAVGSRPSLCLRVRVRVRGESPQTHLLSRVPDCKAPYHDSLRPACPSAPQDTRSSPNPEAAPWRGGPTGVRARQGSRLRMHAGSESLLGGT